MQNQRLKNYLVAMQPADWTAMAQYMASPFFYKRAETVCLWQYIAKMYADDGNLDAINWNTAHLSAILTANMGQKAASRLSWVAADLVACVADCWAQQSLAQHPRLHHELRIDACEMRGLYDEMTKHIDTMEAQNEAQNLRTLSYLETNVSIAKKRIHIEQLTSRQRFEIEGLDAAIDALFVAHKLEVHANLLSRAAIYSQAVTPDPLVECLILQVQLSPTLHAQPFVCLHYESIRCMQNADPQLFTEFVALLKQLQNVLNYDELRRAYQYAENICALRIRHGNTDYWAQLFALYQQGVSQHTLRNVNGVLPAALFKNVVTVALRFAAFDWVLGFVREQSAFLPPSERDEVFEFNLATIFFAQARYTDTLELIGRTAYTDLTRKLSARLLLLKTYYALQGHDAYYGDVLESELAAFKMFVYRLRGLSKDNQLQYRNFISCLRKLIYLPPKNREKALRLQRTIERTPFLAERAWLLSVLSLSYQA